MLYDPKWGAKKSFTEWLGTQPADKPYDYLDPYNCAVAQWLQKTSAGWDLNRIASSPKFEKSIGVFPIVAVAPYTFGAAYKRAKVTNPFVRAWLRIKAPFYRRLRLV